MTPLGHHVLHLVVFFGILFCVGLLAALRERRAKMKAKRSGRGH